MSIQQGTITIDNVVYKWSPVLVSEDERVIYSRQYSTRYAWRVFQDKMNYNYTDSWYSGRGSGDGALPQWVGFDYEKPIKKIGVALTYDSYDAGKPLDFQIQYFDGENLVDIISLVNESNLVGKTKLYLFEKPVVAEKFRYHVTKNSSNNIYPTILHRLYLLDEKEFTGEYELVEKFQDENGVAIKEDINIIVAANDNYSFNAPEIVGYEYVGYKVDGGALQLSTPAVIANVDNNHVVVFVYKKKEIVGNELVVTGMVVHFASPLVPDGWLVCDGSEVSQVKYSELYKVVGGIYGECEDENNFRLPDLRGSFIRGYDYGRGLDEGRQFGSEQEDALQDHSHYSGSVVTRSMVGEATVARVADETRPYNIALLPCIKY